jgi:hypothetical protein
MEQQNHGDQLSGEPADQLANQSGGVSRGLAKSTLQKLGCHGPRGRSFPPRAGLADLRRALWPLCLAGRGKMRRRGGGKGMLNLTTPSTFTINLRIASSRTIASLFFFFSLLLSSSARREVAAFKPRGRGRGKDAYFPNLPNFLWRLPCCW